MRSLFSSLRNVAPFLFGDRPALALTRSLREVRSGGTPSAGFSAEPRQSGLLLRGSLEDLQLDGVQLAECNVAGARLSSVSFAGGHWSRSNLRGAQLERVEAASSSWTILDLEGASLLQFRAEDSHLSLLSLRDAHCSDSSFAGSTLVLCDLSGAQLQKVDLSRCRLEGCDFQGAVLDGVSFRGSDLRSSLFAEAWLADTDFSDALVSGADFRRVGGLSDAQRTDLRSRGARTGGGMLYRLWASLLARRPGATPHRRVLRAVAITWATLALMVPSLFFLRAILDPIDPESPPSYEAE
jgi:uncharacterized protein YjbI with pentapeptide repeats